MIRYNLKSGERDLSIGDIGVRVNGPKIQFRVRVKDFQSRNLSGLRISNFAKNLVFDIATKFRIGFRVNDLKIRFRLGLRISISTISEIGFQGCSSIHNVAMILKF